jgi:hypothetical protein
MITRSGIRFAAAACVLLVGCNGDAVGPGPDEQARLDADLSVLASEGALSFMGLMAFAHATVPTPPDVRNLRIKYFDSDGDQQTFYDDLETASINLRVDIDADLNNGDWSASVERTIDITVSGLQGRETTRIWNGSSSGTLETRHTHDGETRSYHITSSAVIDDVVVPVGESHLPLSGTITDAMTVRWTQDGATNTAERTVTVTFNGTQNPTVTISGH